MIDRINALTISANERFAAVFDTTFDDASSADYSPQDRNVLLPSDC